MSAMPRFDANLPAFWCLLSQREENLGLLMLHKGPCGSIILSPSHLILGPSPLSMLSSYGLFSSSELKLFLLNKMRKLVLP